jgi:Transcription factor WhiB
VRQPCLVCALITHQEFGIWGGWGENERRLLHRQWRETRGTADEEPPQP